MDLGTLVKLRKSLYLRSLTLSLISYTYFCDGAIGILLFFLSYKLNQPSKIVYGSTGSHMEPVNKF